MKTTSDNQHRIFLILERLWLFAAVMGATLTVFYIIQGDNDSALFFLGFFVLSGLFYLLRRRQRIRHGAGAAGRPPQPPGGKGPGKGK